MNRLLTISTIAMFAVVLGLGVLSPAMAAKEPKVDVCHFAEEETVVDSDGVETFIPAHWKIINISQKGADNGHVGHHTDPDANNDGASDDPQSDFEVANFPGLCDSLIATNPDLPE
jgi:hypothetical protein